MNTDAKWPESNVSGIFRRVEKLEAENRKLKRLGVLIGLSAVVFVTMAQIRQTSGTVPKVIEAQRFILRDVGGKETATLGMTDDGPALDLKWTPSDAVRRLGGPASLETKLTAVLLEMSGAQTSGKSDPQMWLSRGNISFMDSEFKPRLTMSSAPAIQLTDEQGFQTTIGRAELEAVKTGESRKTSAASIVIFDKEGKVIWKAPLQ